MPQFHYLQKGKKACIHPEGLAGVGGMQPELSSRRPPPTHGGTYSLF